ncbi:hypothetical protein [Phenylobacterium sp.]|jgi:hypothetical protein|uniref:hypothetical protein n=1 Tax=Phenylobacterium sp. TaxID=1871053 RepID=UPI002F3EEB34
MKLEPVLLTAAALALAALPGAAAEKAKPAAAKCFTAEQIGGHKVGDPRTLFLKAAGATWRVDMETNCLGGVKPGDPLKIGQSAGASNGICEPADLEVRSELGGGGLPIRCRIDKITRLTPAQASALPKDQQP